jgi:hypothetical protein
MYESWEERSWSFRGLDLWIEEVPRNFFDVCNKMAKRRFSEKGDLFCCTGFV